MTDRDQNFDITADPPIPNDPVVAGVPNTRFIADQAPECPAATILPLTTNFTAVTQEIGNMQPNGDTNQTIGLQWGWLSLLQQDPLNAPAENADTIYQHVIILFTDGLNTMNRLSGDGSNAGGSGVDARMRALCDNIKAGIDPKTGKSKFTIFTVQIDTDGAGQSAVLPYCASAPEDFYMLKKASQISTAFASIGTQIAKLRVSH